MTIASTSIVLVFLGLVLLMTGYTKRDTGTGPFLIWIGVLTMLSTIVYYILRTLQ